ncbi:hypothetical protein HMPREF0731_2916, partial [Pseudoroseomonas cervicalis ATCC 49957]
MPSTIRAAAETGFKGSKAARSWLCGTGGAAWRAPERSASLYHSGRRGAAGAAWPAG